MPDKYSDIDRINKIRQDFVANVSHELRTPLTVIHGYIETLLSLYQLDPKLHSIFEKINEQTQRMENLVEDLLLLSKIESENPQAKHELIDVAKLIAAIKRDAENLSQGKHQLKFSIAQGLNLLGEEREIRSAFSNLIINAIKYTPAEKTISVKWRQEKDFAVFSVQDNGVGIAAKHIPRLTERFYRVDKSRSRQSGGTGLGLAIVKHVLLRHEANLEINSEVGKGSCFSCFFPVQRLG